VPNGRSRVETFAGEGDEPLGGARPCPSGRARDVDVAREIESLDAGLGERARRKLGLDRPPRDEADPEPALDRAAYGLLKPELERNREVTELRAALPQLVLDHLPDARPLLHQDQRPLGELVEPDGAAGERMAGRAGEDHLVEEERLEDDAPVAPRGAD